MFGIVPFASGNFFPREIVTIYSPNCHVVFTLHNKLLFRIYSGPDTILSDLYY